MYVTQLAALLTAIGAVLSGVATLVRAIRQSTHDRKTSK
jgi:hypothetical protein